jgi:hypothetical protein
LWIIERRYFDEDQKEKKDRMRKRWGLRGLWGGGGEGGFTAQLFGEGEGEG